MKTTIRNQIFIPILALLILFPFISYIVFSTSISKYMQNVANDEMIALMGVIQPIALDIFKDNKETSADKKPNIALEKTEAKEFFTRIKTQLSKTKNNAQIIILNAKYERVYPKVYNELDNSENVYNYISSQISGGTIQNKTTPQKITVNETEYLAVFRDLENAQNASAKYFIIYCPVNNIDNLVQSMAWFIFIITAVLALLTIITVWIISGKISKPIKHVNDISKKIGKGNFAKIAEKSNIVEINALCDSINDMSNQLQHNDLAQKTFFQNASHELRTPLMSIHGYAEGLHLGVFTDTKEALLVIMKESEKLTKLVDGLLMLSRLDNNKQMLDMQPVNLKDFINGYIKLLNGIALERNIKINVECNAEDLIICADEDLLAKAFTNIVSNCIRYARSTVNISATQNNGYAKIVIEDDGVGFTQEEIPLIFDRFYKGKGGNAGIGLAIAKSSILYMSGNIRAYNQENGAGFEINIPN